MSGTIYDTQRYVLKNDKHYKFWEITLHETFYITRHGRIGTAGQKTIKEFRNKWEAQRAFSSIIESKKRKGYVYDGTVKSAVDVGMSNVRSALEKTASGYEKATQPQQQLAIRTIILD